MSRAKVRATLCLSIVVAAGIALFAPVYQPASAFEVLSDRSVAGKLPWGKVSRSLDLSLSSDAYAYAQGSPITVKLILENLGRDLETFPPCSEWDWYGFQINDPSGNVVQRKADGSIKTCSFSPISWHIVSRELLQSTFNLRSKYDLTTPGVYTIRATSNIYLPAVPATPQPGASASTYPWTFPFYTTVESNTITVKVEGAND
ncbi:MAG TPA: hypothetical protein VGW96_02240 [Candidatus Eremiobacteraceae bacterium]|nr:hypothetical protein [Candidatus Eremiobacteraceae bacterium]